MAFASNRILRNCFCVFDAFWMHLLILLACKPEVPQCVSVLPYPSAPLRCPTIEELLTLGILERITVIVLLGVLQVLLLKLWNVCGAIGHQCITITH